MKNLFTLIIAIFAMAVLVTSCGKNGATGPQGPAGPTGATGATGAVGAAGPAGANGSVIYSGTSAPATSLGAVGDYYLNRSSGALYGPKTASGWGTAISLKGATGAAGANGTNGTNGTNGSKMYSGTTVPAPTLGADGDFYLNKSTYLLYGPKANGSWGTGLSLRGPQGNANVKIDTFTVKSADWTYAAIYYVGTVPNVSRGYFTQYYDRTETAITTAILNSGIIMVYFQSEPDNLPTNWQPMPLSFEVGNSYSINYAYETSVGKIRLHFFLTKVVNDPPALNTYTQPTRKFKIIVMTGTVLSAIKDNHVNINDYNAVTKFTGLWQSDKL